MIIAMEVSLLGPCSPAQCPYLVHVVQHSVPVLDCSHFIAVVAVRVQYSRAKYPSCYQIILAISLEQSTESLPGSQFVVRAQIAGYFRRCDP